MSEQQDVQVGPVTRVARDLTEIVRLTESLATQAFHQANARIDGTGLPGGLAMVDLANVGSPGEWVEHVAADELRHLSTCTRPSHSDCAYDEHAAVEDEDTEPPLQTLLFWSEAWRDLHGFPLERRPTTASEANLLRYLLDWAWDHEPHFEDMAADINQARLRLEDVVHAGRRQTRTRVTCPDCDNPPRLLLLAGQREDRTDDAWKCPRCKRRFGHEEFRRAHAKMLRSEGAERWVHQADAIWILRDQGRAERTVRQWLADGEASAYCDPVSHEVWVWWPDLWTRHLMTPTRLRVVQG